MKRALVTSLLLVVAVPAMAFKTTVRRGDRVAILRAPMSETYRSEQRVANTVCLYLRRELRNRGMDAFDAGLTWDELVREGKTDADYYVEVVGGDADSASLGGVGVGNRNVGVDLAVVMARVAATLRLYDGRTLELIDTLALRRSSSTIMPTAIGVGRDHFSFWIAIPFVEGARYRAAARAVAQDAAAQIATAGE